MISNIEFTSNVYPLNDKKSIYTDMSFKAQIWNYERIHELYQRSHDTDWPEMQDKIRIEQPTCMLNKEDPCWGMVNTERGIKWICKCTKMDCRYISECRKDNPCTPDEVEENSSKNEDSYGYELFCHNYSAYPIVDDDNSDAICLEPYMIANSNFNDGKDVKIFFDEIADTNANADPVNLSECDAEESINTNVEDEPHSDEEPQGRFAFAKPYDVSDELSDNDLNGNIFESFVECSQQSIIEASPDSSFFVDAGPGTGKTYTLIKKLDYLVTSCEVDPEAIIVLCFTNAAVDEIKSRLNSYVINGADRGLRNIDVRTFHSFAWWLINQANEALTDYGWKTIYLNSLDYDSSLKKATTVISRYPKEVVGSWEYFFVDEVQDLTGTLGRFVLTIVNACKINNCALTALGDMCQAIYDYNIEDDLKAIDFYNALYRKLNGYAQFVKLIGNHRQTSDLISMTGDLRTAILSQNINYMKDATQELMETVTKRSYSDALALNKYEDGTVSLLLRNNGQTLKMSSDLRKKGIPHTLTLNNTNNNYATWIADVFTNYSNDYISEEEFENRFVSISSLKPENVWRRIQQALHTKNDRVNVRELLDSIAVSKIDDPIFRTNINGNVVVSNIHRAKGREYDTVLVDLNFIESLKKTENEEEFRILYVAVTRPKRDLIVAPLNKSDDLYKISVFNTKRSRWGRMSNGKVKFFEYKSDIDLNIDSFVGADQGILSLIEIGDEISFKRTFKNHNVYYDIIHDRSNSIIGQVGNSFVDDIKFRMSIDSNSMIEMPASIDDLYVSGVYSQVADSDYLKSHPALLDYAPNGVWKWVEIIGIGHMNYDVY